VLAEIERAGLVENAARRGEELKQLIRDFDAPLIDAVRGHGLLIGIGLTDGEAHRLSDAALANGLIINAPNESSIRLAPPLIIGDAELRDFRERFGRALAAV
jgi:acetylornithine/N-succinyldiaminopimelate aminotransferase